MSDTPPPSELPRPSQRFILHGLFELRYTPVHAAEAVGIRDLADVEFLRADETLENALNGS